MDIQRIATHLLFRDGRVNLAFPQKSLDAFEQAIKASEVMHSGQIRFAVEASLDGLPLFKGQSANERAIEVFSQMRVWDTSHNNGVLIYVLLADHAVEIVADRGIDACVGNETWRAICAEVEDDFAIGDYASGVLLGIALITDALKEYFPKTDQRLALNLAMAYQDPVDLVLS